MKKLVAVFAVTFMAFTFVPAAEAQDAPSVVTTTATRVAVVFEKSVRNRTVLELAVQEALRDAGYQPVLATGIRALRSERDWKKLPQGVSQVLIVSDARVVTRRDNQTSPRIVIGNASRGGISGQIRWQKTTASLDAKMVNVADRALVGFGHGAGEAGNLERIQVSSASVIDIVKTAGLWRQRIREDMVYTAAKKAATEAIKSLR